MRQSYICLIVSSAGIVVVVDVDKRRTNMICVDQSISTAIERWMMEGCGVLCAFKEAKKLYTPGLS